MELVTLCSFVVVGYSLIYKLFFYYLMGASWYLSTITPLAIVLGSFKLISAVVVSSLFIFCLKFLFKRISDKSSVRVLYIVRFLSGLVIFLLIFTLTFGWSWSFIPQFLKIDIHFSILVIGLIFLLLDAIYSERKMKVKKYGFVIYIFYILAGSIFSGVIEVDLINNNKSQILSLVKLNNDAGEWYLVDYSDDKMLLVAGNNENNIEENIFKLVEFKEVDKIISHKYVDHLGYKLKEISVNGVKN